MMQKSTLEKCWIFFRAYKYFKMLSLYGDLPWVEHTLSEDSEELYLPRDPRDVVAQNILNNLKYAEEHIKVDGDGNNTINRAVVQSLISRFVCLKGHGENIMPYQMPQPI